MKAKLMTIKFANIKEGDDLPDLEIPITAKGIVTGALASQDYQDVHHDKDAAVKAGMPNIFMNILTTNGHASRYLTDWCGPSGRIKNVDFRLGAPNLPGDTMVFKAEITKKYNEGGENLVDITFKGKNGMGYHVAGTATVNLP